jgi:hypothetical protein
VTDMVALAGGSGRIVLLAYITFSAYLSICQAALEYNLYAPISSWRDCVGFIFYPLLKVNYMPTGMSLRRWRRQY